MYHKLSEETLLSKKTKKNHQVDALFRKAIVLDELNHYLDNLLPDQLKTQFKIAHYKAGKLILITHSAGLGIRFRAHQSTIIEGLRRLETFANLQKIDLKVRPVDPVIPKAQYRRKPLSKENAQAIQELADTTDEPVLKRALEALAKQATHAEK